MKKKILIVEDEKLIAKEIEMVIKTINFKVIDIVDNGSEAIEITKNQNPDLVIMDIKLAGKLNGLATAKIIWQKFNIPIIFLTAYSDKDSLSDAMKSKPYSFLTKPFNEDTLKSNILLALEHFKEDKKFFEKFDETKSLLTQYKKQTNLISSQIKNLIRTDNIAKSKKMKSVIKLAKKAARYPKSNVLILGETGSGKEVISKIIHFAHDYRKGKYCPVNCSAIPSELFESILFGHEKGSFTHAHKQKIGIFEEAENGTILLDEIAEIPAKIQTKLLRVLEENEIRRVGDNKTININTRIISSTNQDVTSLIDKNQFRLDLIHRLNTIEIYIPPLRERKEDIKPLFNSYLDYFQQKLKKIITQVDSKIYNYLEQYSFPGNVRELKNIIERAVIFNETGKLTTKDFRLGQKNPFPKAMNYPNTLNLEDNEIKLIKIALTKTKRNITKAAELLGISRYALTRRMKKYNLQ